MTLETAAPPGNVSDTLNVPVAGPASLASLVFVPESGVLVELSGAESAPVSGCPTVPSWASLPPPSLAVASPPPSAEPEGPPELLLLEHAAADAHTMPETATSAARRPNERLLIAGADS
jgi:hypothetical protein